MSTFHFQFSRTNESARERRQIFVLEVRDDLTPTPENKEPLKDAKSTEGVAKGKAKGAGDLAASELNRAKAVPQAGAGSKEQQEMAKGVEGLLKWTSEKAHGYRLNAPEGSLRGRAATAVRDLAEAGARKLQEGQEPVQPGVPKGPGKPEAGTAKGPGRPDAGTAKPGGPDAPPPPGSPDAPGKPDGPATPDAKKPPEAGTPDGKKPDKGPDGGKAERPEGETHRDRIGKEMAKAVEKMQNAKNLGEVLEATMEFLATAIEYGQRIFDKSLNEPINKKVEGGAAEGGKKESGKTEADARQRVTQEVQQEQKKTEQPLPQTVENLQKNKHEQVQNNTADMKKYDGSILEARNENEGLLKKEGEMKVKLNAMEKKDTAEYKILDAQLKGLQKKIEANNQVIEQLTKSRDELGAKNEKLNAEIKVLNEMKTQVHEAMEKGLQELNKVLEGMDAGKKPFDSVSLDATTGEFVLKGVKAETDKLLPGLKKDNEGNARVKPAEIAGLLQALKKQPEGGAKKN